MEMNAIIYGSKSYSKIIELLAKGLGYKILGFIDDYDNNNTLGNYEKNKARLITNNVPVFLGVGYSNLVKREILLNQLLFDGINLPNLIHPTAYIGDTTQICSANIIMAGTVIDEFCQIGHGNVFWTNTNISHNCLIHNNCFFSPSATVCGNAEICSNSFIGAGSVIINNTKVHDNSFIKANSIFKKHSAINE